MLTQPLHLYSIKVLTDLVQAGARFSIDMQVLTDLKTLVGETSRVSTP